MNSGLSPEEILRMKEIQGGIEYDDPISKQKTDRDNLISEASLESKIEHIEMDESISPASATAPAPAPAPALGNAKNINTVGLDDSVNRNSFGKAQSVSDSPAFDSGWKNLPLTILPSKGMFYPDKTKVAIRAAEVREIRHFSTIDEDDQLDIEEKLSYILDRCFRMDFPGEGVVSYKDLKQEDRFFIIMAIRDLTFVRGENSIVLKPKKKCKETPDCPFTEGLELRTGVLNSYTIDRDIMKYYNPETRSFIFTVKRTGKTVEMTVPSIGVTQAISEFVRNEYSRNNSIDEGFIQIAPFIFNEWRDLTPDKIKVKLRESDFWTKEEYSLYFGLSEKIKIGTTLEAKQKCPVCGEEEVTADITFPGGIRSLFLISNIFGELL